MGQVVDKEKPSVAQEVNHLVEALVTSVINRETNDQLLERLVASVKQNVNNKRG